MNYKSKPSFLFIVFSSIVAGLTVAVMVMAWTNPTGNPPIGGGALYYSGGNMGIGTSTPLAQLHLYSNTSNGLFIQNTGTGYAGVRVQTSNGSYFTGINPLKSSWDLYDNTASLTRLTVQADGNVGIGTTTPDSNYKLTTSGGGVKAENSSALQSAGYFSNAGGGPAITAGTGGMTLGGVNKTAWPSGGTSQWVDGTGGIIYYNGGNVGIGTSTPLAQLHLYSNTSNGLFIQNTGTGYAGVRVQTSNGSYFTGINPLKSSWDLYDNTASLTRLTVQADGNVGIGTPAPTSKLQVVGLPVYANNAAAVAGGLTAGAFYRTGADPDPVMIVH